LTIIMGVNCFEHSALQWLEASISVSECRGGDASETFFKK